MPLLTRLQKAQKRKEIILNRLIDKISRYSVTIDGQLQKNVIEISKIEKRISVSHPNYDALTFEQKKEIVKLKECYNFYVQWQFFLL